MKTKPLLIGLGLPICLLFGTIFLIRSIPPKPPESVAVPVTGYNYTYEGVQGFSVNGGAGSNLPPYGGGGSLSCCVMIASKWTPGLKATVHWTIGHFTRPWAVREHMTIREQEACCWTERTLEKTVLVEHYDEPGTVQVFFLPDDEIKVYSHDSGPEGPGHPSKMPYPKDPNPNKEDNDEFTPGKARPAK